MKDTRYSINQEFAGYFGPRYVARFCGVWLGAFETLEQAETEAKAHNLRRFDPSGTPQQDVIDDICNELVGEDERIAAFELNEEA